MSRRLIAFVLTTSLLAGCRPVTTVGKLDARLTSAPNAQDLAALAQEARNAAQQATDPKDRVAYYRIAAVAAWHAGAPGKAAVLPISAAGAAACDALPAKDMTAPRDCSLIRLAAPLAVQDDLARDLITLQHQLPGTPGAKLPAADFARLQKLFTQFETQFDQVAAIRAGLAHLDVRPELTVGTDRRWLIIYCNAVKAWSLSGDVEDVPMAEFSDMAQRKKTMSERLEAHGVTNDCRTITATQTAGTDL
jgi:hypothetical protein